MFDVICDVLMPWDIQGVLRTQQNSERTVTLSNGVLLESVRTEKKGVSALFIDNGKRGFACSTDISVHGANTVMHEALDNLRSMTRVNEFAPVASGGRSSFPTVKDTAQSEIVELASTLDTRIVSMCPKASGRRIQIATLVTQKLICTHDGRCISVFLPRTNVYVTLSAKNSRGESASIRDAYGGACYASQLLNNIEVMDGFINELYDDVQKKCEASALESAEYECVLSGCTGILIHEAFGHIAEGDAVAAGSVLAGKLGERIVSPLISATDFAKSAFGQPVPQPLEVDDEGVQCVDAPILEKGVLKGYMLDTRTAAQLGLKNTGNARAATFGDIPVVRMRNTAIHPGNSTLDELIASVEDGVYVKRTGGGQADMTGKFMFAVQTAYRIHSGKVKEPLGNITCTGSSFRTLGEVKMVGNDIHWPHSSMCGKEAQVIPVGMAGPSVRSIAYFGGGERNE